MIIYLVVGIIWMVVSALILFWTEKITDRTVKNLYFTIIMVLKLIIWPLDIVCCAFNLWMVLRDKSGKYVDEMWDDLTNEETD